MLPNLDIKLQLYTASFAPSELHTLRVCFLQKECARTISIGSALGCQNTPQIKTFAGGFFKMYLMMISRVMGWSIQQPAFTTAAILTIFSDFL